MAINESIYVLQPVKAIVKEITNFLLVLIFELRYDHGKTLNAAVKDVISMINAPMALLFNVKALNHYKVMVWSTNLWCDCVSLTNPNHHLFHSQNRSSLFLLNY